MKNYLFCSIFFLLLFQIPKSLLAQVTTSAISGRVVDDKQNPIKDAVVKISFAEAGIRLSIKTQENGTFDISNMRVGGPYVVEVEANGLFKKVDNIYLQLGVTYSVDVVLKEDVQELASVNIVGKKNSVFDGKRTGASTNVGAKQLIDMPSISRSADDFTRLTPSASATYNGTSFAGRNGQYNNLSLDGAIFNNPFGLDAPGPGGQAGAQPISLDAIEQIQVNIAPYDVTQSGFTGAGVNTVTKSGTNTLKGAVFGYFRNDAMTGKKVDGVNIDVPSLSQLQVGAIIGGPIIKDKLFYFASFETEQRSDAGTNYKPWDGKSEISGNTSRVLESDLIAVRKVLQDTFGYDAGAYQGFTFKQTNYKWLGKISWNINANNRLDFTFNGLYADKDKPAHPSAIASRGPDPLTLQFQNAGYKIHTDVTSFNIELNTTKPSVFANKLKIVTTLFNENRTPFSVPAPAITLTKYGQSYIIAGHEPFSIHNLLTQNVTQFIDNFSYYINKHKITAGVSFELFNFSNQFNLTGYGFQVFGNMSVEDFIAHPSISSNNTSVFTKNDFDVARVKNASNRWPLTKLNIAQASAYLQDEWKATQNLNITVGLRIDVPLYFSSSYENIKYDTDGSFMSSTVETPTIANNENLILYDENGKIVTNGQGKDLDNTKLPNATPLFSPRIGFNWNVLGDRTLQLRGGSGIFTGRFPFVWIANHLQNPFSGYYNVTAKNFKWPQVWRTNIGVDVSLPTNTILTFDFIYTKDINSMMVRNYNLGNPSKQLVSNTNDTRQVYNDVDKGSSNTYVFTNTNVGQSFNATVQLQQVIAKDFNIMVAYNFMYATDASSISAEISGDAFDRNPILNNANKAIETRSLYGNTHRFITAINKKFVYGSEDNDMKQSTTISFFGSLTSGNRFSYIYAGDANNDGSYTNDLLYIPTDAEIDKMKFQDIISALGTIITATEQRAGLKAYITQDEYLSSRRGAYAEKNEGQNPWFSQVDMRILQDIPFKIKGKKQSVQIILDIINLGNLLNSSWGLVKFASIASYYNPVGISVQKNTNGEYESTYTFDPTKSKQTFQINTDLFSRWQMQFGLRYIF